MTRPVTMGIILNTRASPWAVDMGSVYRAPVFTGRVWQKHWLLGTHYPYPWAIDMAHNPWIQL